VLLRKVAAGAVLRRGVAPNLDFMPSGAAPNFVLSLLYANKLREFIAEHKLRYDKIVFDSPPIIGVSDASVLASVVDGVVLLIQHRRNPQSMVLRARQIVDGVKTPILGVVLSQVPPGAGEDYSYYTSNYAYYGEGGRRSKRGVPAASTTAGAEHIPLAEPDPTDRRG
jgi:Mrp family chromosome partitioning ATPase